MLRAHRHPRAAAAPGGLREGGRYLVGGGGDGLGERLALRLVRELGARVVLFGAAPGAGPDEGRLLHVPGRPGQYTDARGAVQVARHTLGGLDGVLHCPSGGELRLLARQSTAVARETLADAVNGAAHLDRATAALPLDFFALVTDAAPYQALAGASVPAAVARALGSIAATRARLAAAGSRCGASVAVCRPGDADRLGALADALGGGRRAGHAPRREPPDLACGGDLPSRMTRCGPGDAPPLTGRGPAPAAMAGLSHETSGRARGLGRRPAER